MPAPAFCLPNRKPMMAAVLSTHNLRKSFGPVRANNDITISVESGELLCLFGENGAGKSTLSACLTGLLQPDSGDIIFKGKKVRLKSAAEAILMGIGLVHQHFVLVPDFTVLENIVIGAEHGLVVNYAAAEQKLRALCNTYDIEIAPNARVRDLTVGEQQWVELLKALYFQASVLILDEPTATLDIEGSKKLFRIIDMLRSTGMAIIIITHKLDEVMQSDRVTVLRQGRVVGELMTAQTTPAELTRLMVGHEIEARQRTGAVAGQARLVLENVTVLGAGQKPDLDAVSLTVHRGEILGIAGVAGNGQTPLIEVIAGINRPTSGRILVDGVDITELGARQTMALGVGHIPDDRFEKGLVGEFSIAENLILGNHRDRYAKGLFVDRALMAQKARKAMDDFSIAAPGAETQVCNLSGGNAQRVILARELDIAQSVLLANQPTRGLDVGVIEYIHRRILDKRGEGVATIYASSELEALLYLCDRIGVMFQGRLMGIVDTNGTSLEEIGLLMAGREVEGVR